MVSLIRPPPTVVVMPTAAALRVVVAVDPFVLRSAFGTVLGRQAGLDVVVCPQGADPVALAAGTGAQLVLSSGDGSDAETVLLSLATTAAPWPRATAAAVAAMCDRLSDELPSVRFVGPA